MTDFSKIQGVAAPLPLNNLDTDQIMPKRFLFGIDKSGLADGTLHDMRFDADDKPIADFVLNQPAYAQANILVTGSNFGCGSSREHAVWGLQQLGFDAIISSSYGEIFYFNAGNNRLLLVILKPEEIEELTAEISDPANNQLTIDVERQVVITASGREFAFDLTARQKGMILEGLDMVQASLRQLPEIEAFEQRHWAQNPWAKIDLPRMNIKYP
ncbi:3-isopropylmalate dehydratase, small subunit [Formivibrio citricus]|uniref:3-isopropylmalate dehydratase small subunit n=1 Tax=Formivibrio citricus TaxID=83765 RepID=A0A1I4YIZ7_9NEIS|nr:3-isopropylmalate dehydratase small subunit [Formivibrio citricus]SFN37539.1 3-isopropylmalate dehydratase, small subunit [Formivibrio citricus]